MSNLKKHRQNFISSFEEYRESYNLLRKRDSSMFEDVMRADWNDTAARKIKSEFIIPQMNLADQVDDHHNGIRQQYDKKIHALIQYEEVDKKIEKKETESKEKFNNLVQEQDKLNSLIDEGHNIGKTIGSTILEIEELLSAADASGGGIPEIYSGREERVRTYSATPVSEKRTDSNVKKDKNSLDANPDFSDSTDSESKTIFSDPDVLDKGRSTIEKKIDSLDEELIKVQLKDFFGIER